jgi:hypothetical protein
VHIKSKGEHAVVTGDLFHSPIQCLHPEWENAFDWDKDLGARTRRSFMEENADNGSLICTIHFPLPSAGYFWRQGNAFRFEYDKCDW